MRLTFVMLLSCLGMISTSVAVVFAMKARNTEDSWRERYEELEAQQREAASRDENSQDQKIEQTAKEPNGEKRDDDRDSVNEVEVDPTKTGCPAETADYPSPYFSDTVLLRLPNNVTEANFVEFTPTFARLSAPVESVSCVAGMPGAMISYMAMTFFEDDTRKDLAALRDETLEVMGYVGGQFSNEKRDDKLRFYQMVLDVPGNEEKPEPGRALLQMSAANGLIYVIVYESHPDAWSALEQTFYASAATMRFLPRGMEGNLVEKPKETVPQVRQAKAEVQGALDHDIIRRIVRAHINEVRSCYNAGLVNDATLAGRVSINFVISGTGKVGSSVVQESTVKDSSVANCIANAVKRWQFPKPRGGGNVIVTYPFNLEPG